MLSPLTFDLVDRRIAIHVEDEPWRSHVVEALGRAQVEPGGEAALSIQVRRAGARYAILVAGQVVDEVPVGYLVNTVERVLVERLMPLRPDVVWLHAGAARRDDGFGVLLAGAGGQGKSTLTIGLVKRGWRYLSDDTVPIVASTLEALPFPRTPGARVRRAKDARRPIHDLPKLTLALRDGQVQREPARLSHVVFPRFDPEAPAELRPLSKSAAAATLFCHCRRAREDRQRNVAVVGRIARALPALELSYGDPEDALDRIEELGRRPASLAAPD